MIKLGVGIPAYGSSLDVGHAGMWLALGVALVQSQEKFQLASFANYHINGVDLCRNTMMFDAIDAGCDWLLMVDADTYHYAGLEAIGDNGVDVLQMVMDGERAGAAAIGAPVRVRGKSTYIYNIRPPDGKDLPPDDVWRGRVFEVSHIGAAFAAYNLKWLRKHWPEGPWFMNVPARSGRPRYEIGEDVFFCAQARGLGGTILCDGRFEPKHVGGRKIVGED
jgi:hypothetical protein